MDRKTSLRKRGSLALAVGLGLAACQTPYKAAKIERGARTLKIQASEDPNSTLPNPKEGKALAAALKSEKTGTGNAAVEQNARLAHLYLARGDLVKAGALAAKALELDFRNREAKLVLAHIGYLQDRLPYAERILVALGGEKAPEADVVNLLGLIARKRGDDAEALRLVEAASIKDPKHVAGRLNAGVLRLRLGQYEAAARHFKDVLKLDHGNPDAELHLAVIFAVKGQRKKAEEFYARVKSSRGDQPIIYYNIAILEARSRNYDEALEAMQEYAERSSAKPADVDRAMAMIEEYRLQRAQARPTSDEKIEALVESAADESGDEAAFDEDERKTTNSNTSMGVVAH